MSTNVHSYGTSVNGSGNGRVPPMDLCHAAQGHFGVEPAISRNDLDQMFLHFLRDPTLFDFAVESPAVQVDHFQTGEEEYQQLFAAMRDQHTQHGEFTHESLTNWLTNCRSANFSNLSEQQWERLLSNDQQTGLLAWAYSRPESELTPEIAKATTKKFIAERTTRFFEQALDQCRPQQLGAPPAVLCRQAEMVALLHQTLADVEAKGQSDYRLYSCSELAVMQFEIEYLVERILVRGQPCLVGGLAKTLKTSVMLDLAISLATGGNFLGRFNVPRACRTLMMSGESGMATIVETAQRICRAANRQFSLIENLILSDQLPLLGDAGHQQRLRRLIASNRIEVLIIDPLFLCLETEGKEGSVFAMGKILRGVAELCGETGCTPVLLHHSKITNTERHAPPQLHDFAWAGFKEFARQWLLLSRRKKYEEGSGQHQLWFAVGGSAGHSGLWGLDINEGAYAGGSTPRTWNVTLTTPAEAIADARAAAAGVAACRAQEQLLARLAADRERLLQLLAEHPDGLTRAEIRRRLGWNGPRLQETETRLRFETRVGECQIRLGNGHLNEALRRLDLGATTEGADATSAAPTD